MTTDMTFCANAGDCSVSDSCKRAISVVNINYPFPPPVSFAAFSPEKGLKCEGFWQGAKLTLKTLEDK